MTQKKLKKLLHYNPNTGQFRALVTRGNCSAGKIIAGYKDLRRGKIYLRFNIGSRLYYGHRLAWLYVHGKMPRVIDHKNGDGTDNKIANLRPATHTQNHINSKRYANNRTGFKGVSISNGGRFRATTSHNGKHVEIGHFDDPQSAHAAYVATVRRLYGEFANEG